MILTVAPASAKGNLVEIGITGGALEHEVRIPASNDDLAFAYPAPPFGRRGLAYTLTLYVEIPGSPQTRVVADPMRYYPRSSSGTPLLVYADSNEWRVPSLSLAHRLDAAIAAATPRPARAASAFIVAIAISSMVALARRSAVRSARRPVREALA